MQLSQTIGCCPSSRSTGISFNRKDFLVCAYEGPFLVVITVKNPDKQIKIADISEKSSKEGNFIRQDTV